MAWPVGDKVNTNIWTHKALEATDLDREVFVVFYLAFLLQTGETPLESIQLRLKADKNRH